MSTKSATKKSLTPVPKPAPEASIASIAVSEPSPSPEIKPEKPIPISTPSIEQLHEDIQSLRQLVIGHSLQIAQIQEALARKRKPTNKVQIKDKQTGTIYPSKNNAYQSLLKSGELKSLVDQGVFGADPTKNTFGWYALVRALPDRFEEVKAEETHEKTEEPHQ